MTATIAAAVEQQGAATREISSNIQSAASGSQSLAGNVDRVAGAIAQTGTAAADFQVAADGLKSCSAQIEDDVRHFFENLQKIAAAASKAA